MRITEKNVAAISLALARLSYQKIISTTNIERPIALKASADAANEFARMLLLTLREHGVDIDTTS